MFGVAKMDGAFLCGFSSYRKLTGASSYGSRHQEWVISVWSNFQLLPNSCLLMSHWQMQVISPSWNSKKWRNRKHLDESFNEEFVDFCFQCTSAFLLYLRITKSLMCFNAKYFSVVFHDFSFLEKMWMFLKAFKGGNSYSKFTKVKYIITAASKRISIPWFKNWAAE